MADRRLVHFLWLAAACVLAACSGGTGVSGVLQVSQVEITPSGGEVVSGGTLQLTGTPRTASGIAVPNRTLTWTSSNPALASVSQSGLVTAHAVGAVTITAAVDGVQGTVGVTVSPVPVNEVTVTPPQADIQVGESVTLTATPRDANGQPLNRVVAWSSDDQAIAQVSTGGVVLGVGPGITTIRATSEGKTGTAQVTVRPRPPVRLSFVTQPPNGVAGQPLAPPIQVAVQDAIGNTVTTATTAITVSLSTNPTGATLQGTTTRNAVAGIATFDDLSLQKAGTGYVLEATAVPLTPGLSNPFAITSATAQRLELTTAPPSTTVSGVPFSPQPVVQLQDAFGNAVALAGIQVSVAIASGAGGTLTGSLTATTNAVGAATFTNLALTGPAGGYTLQFTATGLTPVVSGTITVIGSAATQLALVTPPSSTAQSGIPLAQQPSVQLRDASGSPVPQAGVTVTASVSPGSGSLAGASAVTNASGTATFTSLAISGSVGTYTLSFIAPGTSAVTSGPITLSAGPATRLTIVTQPSSTASSGAPFAQQPVLQVTDLSGNPVAQAGTPVTAALASGSGTLNGTLIVNTDAAGRAGYTNLSITGPAGNYTIGFTAPGLNGAVSTTISLGVGPTQLGITTQPSASAQAGVPFAQQPVIQLRDGSGNAVSQAGVNVTAVIASSPGGSPTLGGTVTVATNASGVATFTNLSISGTLGNYTLRFDAVGLTSVTSQTINVTAGPPAKLGITTQPSSTVQNGQVFPQQPVIQVQDAGGNPVSQAGVNVTASIASGGGTLGGTLTVSTNASGVAAYTGLSITGLVGDRTLRFDASGLTGAVSNAIAVTPGPPVKLTIVTQPSATAQNDVPFAQQPVIRVSDVSDNDVGGATVTVAISAGPAGATLSGGTSAVSQANGLASFTNLAIRGLVGSYTLAFSAAGVSSVTSNSVNLSAGAATKLAVTTQPSSTVQNGQVFPQQPVVQVQDVSGNDVAQSGISVTAVIATGGGTLNGTTTVTTDGGGTATFGGLSICGLAGDRTLEFTSTGLTSATSGTIALTAGQATQLSITTQPSATAQNGVAFPRQPVIQLLDACGSPVAQAGVVVDADLQGGGTAVLLGDTDKTTDANGIATFTDLGIFGTAGTYRIRFRSSGLTQVVSSDIVIP